jgi:hypothetical protein
MATKKPVIAMSAPVAITAALQDGETKSPPKFTSTFYTGGALEINGWDLPVVVDLAGLENGKVLVANLDHDSSKRVGNFAVANDGKTLVASGTASARTEARREVVESAEDGYQWQASLEVNPKEVETVKAGKSVQVNGQSFEGPLYVTRKGVLKGFAFVSHGADDNTTATIAAIAANHKEPEMDKKLKAWIEAMGFVAEDLSAEQLAGLEANYNGQNGAPAKPAKGDSPFAARKIEAKRRQDIRDIADTFIERRDGDIEYIEAIEKLCDHAIEAKMTAQEFKNEMYEVTTLPEARIVQNAGRGKPQVNNRVFQAAICQAGRLPNIEAHFTPQELDLAHERFKGGIGLNQFILQCAEANGYRGDSASKVTIEAQRAAFKMPGYNRIQGGFSTIDVANIVGAVANKFMMDGWNAVDRTCLDIAAIQPVSNFQTRTTVSLTDSVRYEQLGADGEIRHGTLDELTYTVQADTYAKMLAITRKDMINDDLGALTAVPRKLGNGAIKLLNHIFWTEFLSGVSTSFFASGNSNINTAIADMTIGGLDATETIFMNQTNPDGTPLGVMPKILLVPTALKNKALTLMGSMLNSSAITTFAAATGNANPFEGRFKVLSSPYISNSSYTGYTSVAYWLLADPAELPVIAIAALNGRVEPTVESADADFNTLGIQMRGYSDVGVNFQEYRGGVHADGGAS